MVEHLSAREPEVYDPSEKIAQGMGISIRQVSNTLLLLNDGATVPFIARYRKEMTGNLDEVQIREIRDKALILREIERRRAFILETIREQGQLTPELEDRIRKADALAELEDLYLPFKPKRRTRATIAREKGLEPLARLIFDQADIDLLTRASRFVNDGKGVESVEAALAGARDIIAEWVSEDSRVRASLRNLFQRKSSLSSALVTGKEEEAQKYRDYFRYAEPLPKAPSHRVLAVLRGETEGFLRVHIQPEKDEALEVIYRLVLKRRNPAADQVGMAIDDSYARLLMPSLENEMRQWARERADQQAIRVFASNLRQLLMSPPLGQKRILAIDPGFRTGCKLVCLDAQGKLLYNETIYPHPPRREVRQAMNKILQLVDAYAIEAIAIGNGTAGRETEDLIRQIPFDQDIQAVVVNESGASVYSASDLARKEFPDYDVTVRGAVSIGRRLMDPLAELVKIDPKAIGVGQYQHDVDQPALRSSLGEVVESCVNAVGVEVNTASPHLLAYVSGLGPALA
ncbi:MAG TPA: Tex-like N-terminal domain-containing protein, partial [Bacteroidales bacterium]|nr:Tex-like N-terminal domain-containing protein [Bacteroidales bacterium]